MTTIHSKTRGRPGVTIHSETREEFLASRQKITIYTTPDCPQCRRVKDLLNKNRVQYVSKDLRTPADLTDFRMLGLPSLRSPFVIRGDEPFDYLSGDEVEKMPDEEILNFCRSNVPWGSSQKI